MRKHMSYCPLIDSQAADSGTCRDIYWETTPPMHDQQQATRELFHTVRVTRV